MNDLRVKLSAVVIQREVERDMALPVQFSMSRHYRINDDRWETRVSFSAEGRGVSTVLSDTDLEMALDSFRTRIVAPMVHQWRTKVEA